MSEQVQQSSEPAGPSPRFQFRLRTLLFFTFWFAIICSVGATCGIDAGLILLSLSLFFVSGLAQKRRGPAVVWASLFFLAIVVLGCVIYLLPFPLAGLR